MSASGEVGSNPVVGTSGGAVHAPDEPGMSESCRNIETAESKVLSIDESV